MLPLRRSSLARPLLASLLSGLALCTSIAAGARAQQQEVPKAVAEIVERTEAASNRRDLDAIVAAFGEDFVRADGLNVESLARGLEELWSRYPRLSYSIELVGWKETEAGLEYETVTRIEGNDARAGQPLRLEALVRSRQQLRKGRIVSQEILVEQTQILLGERPPLVRVSLPETVGVQQSYNFDVIALDPLGSEVLLGAVTEERVDGLNYLGDRDLELEVLSAGGLFQVGTAPEDPSDRWLSAVVARPGGITFIGRRLRVIP